MKGILRALPIVAGAAMLTSAVAGVAALTPAVAGASPTPQCRTVAFAPQSDNGAFEIVAHSTTCAVARAVAGASRPDRFRSGNPSYAADGFWCFGRTRQLGGTGKQVVGFRCVRRRSFVTFLRG